MFTYIDNIKGYFDRKQNQSHLITELPFHGFLQLLFQIAHLKFASSDETTLSALIKLLNFCESSLRKFGVHSVRLKRAELVDENECDTNDPPSINRQFFTFYPNWLHSSLVVIWLKKRIKNYCKFLLLFFCNFHQIIFPYFTQNRLKNWVPKFKCNRKIHKSVSNFW